MGDFTLPTELLASIETPTLVIEGALSPPFFRNAARAVADALPHGRLCTLDDQTHDIDPEPTAHAVADFLSS
jgi:pimeloyl-ACP methyl ester carboxylesterase